MFLAVAEEHNPEVSLIEIKTGKKQTLTLSVWPLSLSVGDKPNEMLVGTQQEVLKIQIDPLMILERNTKIEFAFGKDTILLDPTEICFVHGAPHPLF